ncbi:GNAT family N-acetyltransferase [Nocardioides sp. SYSU D00038]|uniref:GNAT family N-acetyltransferase n=1 Tax=Nocardioides sp. SYSU D00038 TaxID=2812554 RepID=UPI0019681513|nr:GNAT family N-acetyltransferase [Nocardioides sp. SYSU D00038]
MVSMELVELGALSADDVDRVRAIYEDAFPEALRVPFADLLVDRMLVGVVDAAPVGLALVRDLVADDGADSGWTFLRYYAVGTRGRGDGSRLWAAVTDRLRREGRRLFVWDVEDPDEEGLSPAEVEEHRRRIVFYERLGGRLLPVRDYHPPHDGFAPRLLLMSQELAPGADPDLRSLVEGVFALRYGAGPDHPAVVRTLRASDLD